MTLLGGLWFRPVVDDVHSGIWVHWWCHRWDRSIRLAIRGSPIGCLTQLARRSVAVTVYLRELCACGRSATTQRSYAMDLLRWYRFMWKVARSPGTRRLAMRPATFACGSVSSISRGSPHWRHPDTAQPVAAGQAPGTPNALTGKPTPSTKYAPRTVAHCESVLRSFYEFHLEAGSGPMVNPFPLTRSHPGRPSGRHHNPMEPFRGERTGRYRPRVPPRIPRQIPDERFSELFAALSTHRDRALVALWVSTGARASELLGLTCGDVDPGQQLITVVRKGTKALQLLAGLPRRLRVAAAL